CVQPRVAVFGKKDYQQWLVLRQLARQFALPVEVVGYDIQRAEDGLALSSRNGYLGLGERTQAVQLAQALYAMGEAVRGGERDFATIEARAMQTMAAHGWQPDYMALRRAADLQPARPGDALVALGAARLGSTRLIDNLEIPATA
ncbi:MAG TPA: pantoate--beta-alanine ligase, partial [Burkholderiaceae bacterium]